MPVVGKYKRGPLFTNVPSPIAIARKMDLPETSDILDPTESDEEDNELQCYDPSFYSFTNPYLMKWHHIQKVINIQGARLGFSPALSVMLVLVRLTEA